MCEVKHLTGDVLRLAYMRREEWTRPGQFHDDRPDFPPPSEKTRHGLRTASMTLCETHEAKNVSKCARCAGDRRDNINGIYRKSEGFRSVLKATPDKKVKNKSSGLLLNVETTFLPLTFPSAVIIGLGTIGAASRPKTSSCIWSGDVRAVMAALLRVRLHLHLLPFVPLLAVDSD